jgi:hypothetical protein
MFSSVTLGELGNALDRILTVAEFDRLMVRFAVHSVPGVSTGSKPNRVNALIRWLVQHPEHTGPGGSPLAFEIIEEILRGIRDHIFYNVSEGDPSELLADLCNSMLRDGFQIHDYHLISVLPIEADIPEREDELNQLLDTYGFSIPKGHLEQAISAHARGDWASANSQLRTFIESLFDCIAETLSPGISQTHTTSEARRATLASPQQHFFMSELNEWLNNGGGFVQGFWRRLHPQGAHPGLSDRIDSTFRLHLVILVGHHFLKRLSERT